MRPTLSSWRRASIKPGFGQFEAGRKMRERRLVGIGASRLLAGAQVQPCELGALIGRSDHHRGAVEVSNNLEQALLTLLRASIAP